MGLRSADRIGRRNRESRWLRGNGMRIRVCRQRRRTSCLGRVSGENEEGNQCMDG